MSTRFTKVTVTVTAPITAEDLTEAAKFAAPYFKDHECYLRGIETRPGHDGAPELADLVFSSEKRQPTTEQETTR